MSIRSIGKKWGAGLVVAGLLLQQPLVAAAQSRDDLEKRIQELERKLEKLEKLERLQDEGVAPRRKSKTTSVTTIETPVAQPAAPAEPTLAPHEVKALVQDEIKKTKPIAGWKDGFFLESPGGDFKMKLRGYIQANARWFPNSRVTPASAASTCAACVRSSKARCSSTSTTGSCPTSAVPAARPSRPPSRTPTPTSSTSRTPGSAPASSRSRSASSACSPAPTCCSSSAPSRTTLAPNRDVGFMLHGDVFQNGLLEYQLGIFNGVVDGGSTDGDANSDKDFAGRIFAHPFATTDWDFAKTFGVGFAGTYGNNSDDPIDGTRVRSDGLSTIYRLATGTLGNGTHSRWSPQFYYYWGPFGVMGEYIWSDQAGRITDEEDDTTTQGRFTNDGGFLQTSWVITGEDASYKRVVPFNNFDPANGYWGAFEAAFRASTVGLGAEAFDNGLASRNSSVTNATAYTAGINWYLNNAFRFQVNYTRTDFSDLISIDGGKRSREDVILAEFQIAY